jgi:hypothetical protein
VYCIGVLHHLKTPLDGLRAVIDNVKPGNKFHCWVYEEDDSARKCGECRQRNLFPSSRGNRPVNVGDDRYGGHMGAES